MRIGLLAVLLTLRADSEAVAQPLRFEKETLPNGLRVIYAPMRYAPVVHVRVIYQAGSRDEPADKQGMAHLVEHLMFRGSAHVGDGEHLRAVQRGGGVVGAQTEQDITTYYQTLPRNQLERGLYLEADRMASLKLDESTFQLERQIVLHELARRHEEPELALVDDVLAEVFKVHPYRWSPQGNPTHLNAVRLADIRPFFERYYSPNNATLVITGDFDRDQAKQLTHRYFGWIARGPDLVRKFDSEPAQTASRQVEIVRPVPSPMLLVGCIGPPVGSEDEAAVMILAMAMQNRLRGYLEVTARPLCSSTFTRLMPFQDNGCFYLGGAMVPGADRATVQRILTAQLELLRSEGMMLNDRDFRSVIDELIAQLLSERQTVEGLAGQLGRGELLSGHADASDRLIARLSQVTPRMAFAAAQKYLRPDLLTFVLVNPTSASSPAIPIPADLPHVPATQPIAAARTITFPPDYPASVSPVEELVPFRPYPLTEMTSGGLKVLLGPPLVGDRIGVQLIVPRGAQDDPAGREGAGMLTTSFVTGMASRPEFDPNTGVWLHSPFPYLSSHRRDTTQLIGDAPSALSHSLMRGINRALREQLELGLLDVYFITLKWKLFSDLQESEMRPDAVADRELRREVFAGTPLARELSAGSLRAISRTDLEQSRRNLFDPADAVLVVNGRVDADEVHSLVATLFRNVPRPDLSTPATQPSPAVRVGPRIILIDDPASRQAQIRIGSPTFGWGSPELPAAEVAESLLDERLFRLLRHDAGSTYYVGADFAPYRGGGGFSITTATSIARAAPTLQKLLDTLRQIGSDGVQEDELKHARMERAGRLLVMLQTPQQQASFRADAMLRGDEPNPGRRMQNLLAVGAGDVRDVVAKYASPNRLTIVIVAPATQVQAQLEAFGPVEVRPMPHMRPGAATRPAYEEIPRPM